MLIIHNIMKFDDYDKILMKMEYFDENTLSLNMIMILIIVYHYNEFIILMNIHHFDSN